MITTTARCCLQIRSIRQFFSCEDGPEESKPTESNSSEKTLWWTETKALHKSCYTLEHVLLKQRQKKPEAEVNIFLQPCHVKTWKNQFFRRLKKCLTEYTHTGAQATIFTTGGAWHMCLQWHLRRFRPAKQMLAFDIIPPITPSGFWIAIPPPRQRSNVY